MVPSILLYISSVCKISGWGEVAIIVISMVAAIEIIWQLMSIVQLTTKSKFDLLTGVLTRDEFTQQAEQIIAHAKQCHQVVHVLLININKFKQVNDTLGHAVGDALLTDVASKLREVTPKGDIVARLSGDEFVILASGSESTSYEKIIDAIVSKVNVTTVVGETLTYVSVSIGVASYPTGGGSINSLLRRASIAMLAAKKQIKITVCTGTRKQKPQCKTWHF